MNQFARFVERGMKPPRLVLRVLVLAVAVAHVVGAVAHPGLVTVVRAVFFALFAALAVIPFAADGRLDAWFKKHPLLEYLPAFVIVGGGAFVALTYLWSPRTSLLISVLVTVVCLAVGGVVRARRAE